MTSELLTAVLAERILGWRVCPNRFVTSNRGWLPRHRFRPTERLQDAFKLITAASPTEYSMGGFKGEPCWTKVRIGTVSSNATATSLPMAICLAIAKALDIEVQGRRG